MLECDQLRIDVIDHVEVALNVDSLIAGPVELLLIKSIKLGFYYFLAFFLNVSTGVVDLYRDF